MPDKSNHKGKILIVDDTAVNQKLIESIVKKKNFSTKTANNGQEALDLASNETFDLIFMDIQMPVMDGIEATKRIRNQGIKTTIIAITAMPDSQDICIEAGCNQHLNKPVSKSDIDTILDKYINQ